MAFLVSPFTEYLMLLLPSTPCDSTPSNTLPSTLSPSGEMLWMSFFGLTAFFASLVVFRALRFFWRSATSHLHRLPGPPSTSWLYGNVREYTEAGQTVLWEHWTGIYGNTFRFSTFFNVRPHCPCLFHPLGITFILCPLNPEIFRD